MCFLVSIAKYYEISFYEESIHKYKGEMFLSLIRRRMKGKHMNGMDNPVIQHIVDQMPRLTPKGRILGNFVVQHPRRAVFMTTKELAKACAVSEATVVRFVAQLGYDSYSGFLQALRDLVNTGMTLQDRIELPGLRGPAGDRLGQVMAEEIENMRQFYQTIDRKTLHDFTEQLNAAQSVYVVGSRLSYTFAYYMGWSLTKVRKGVHIVKGSDSTAIDKLNNALPDALVVIIATSRYPNELIRLAKVTRRLDQRLLVIADSPLCPLLPFAHRSLVVASQSIPYIGYIAAMASVISYLVLELGASQPATVRPHQEKLEQAYLENDILFNLLETGRTVK